jgi:hypothetical protein
MDPYLEASWRDVHSRLIIYLTDAIQESLPDSLHARVEERIVLELPEGLAGGALFPDVRITAFNSDPSPASGSQGPAAQPLICEADVEPITEGYVEVIDAGSGNKVVTIIEILSPTNKTPGEAMAAYQRKQRDVCRSDTNLVEIDLLRAGKHVLAVPLANVPPKRRMRYAACVRRATARGVAEFYPIALDQRLPSIKIPLRPGDEDVVLDLQSLIDQAYRRGRYDRTTDYNKDPDPPLTGPEAEWIDALLREKGVRTAPPAQKAKRKKPPRREGE